MMSFLSFLFVFSCLLLILSFTRCFDLEIPLNYTFYDQYPECKNPVWSIGICGGAGVQICAVEQASLQFCKENKVRLNLSPEDPLACDMKGYGCQGSYMQDVLEYMKENGVVDEDCFPYTTGGGGVIPPCPNKCVNGSSWKESKHFIKSWGTVNTSITEDAIIQHLYQEGPLIAIMEIEPGFSQYKAGEIYDCGFFSTNRRNILEEEEEEGKSSSSTPINAALVFMIVGYGEVSSGEKYYVCQNDWGPNWGDQGFYLLKRGSCDTSGFWYTEV